MTQYYVIIHARARHLSRDTQKKKFFFFNVNMAIFLAIFEPQQQDCFWLKSVYLLPYSQKSRSVFQHICGQHRTPHHTCTRERAPNSHVPPDNLGPNTCLQEYVLASPIFLPHFMHLLFLVMLMFCGLLEVAMESEGRAWVRATEWKVGGH